MEFYESYGETNFGVFFMPHSVDRGPVKIGQQSSRPSDIPISDGLTKYAGDSVATT